MQRKGRGPGKTFQTGGRSGGLAVPVNPLRWSYRGPGGQTVTLYPFWYMVEAAVTEVAAVETGHTGGQT